MFQKSDWTDAKAPAVRRSKVTQYYNAGSLSIDEPRDFGAAEILIFEARSV